MKKNILAWLLLGVLALVVGCGPTVKPATLVIGVDETESALKTRGTGIELSTIAAANLLGARDSINVSVLTFGQSVQRLGGSVGVAKDQQPVSSQGQIPDLFKGIKTASVPDARGGTIAPLLEEFATRCKQSTDLMFFLVVTDGEVYDVNTAEGTKRLDAAVAELAKYGNLQRIVIGPLVTNGGAHENWRGVLQKHLEPLGDKVFIYGSAEVNQAKIELQKF